jgi:hypothetical protein
MSDFPLLKTGALAQYPFERRLEYATEVLRFLDGTEQRFRQRGEAGRRWVLRLSLLDEDELAKIEAFFQTEQGRTGSFAFTDPCDGQTYADCSLEKDTIELGYEEIAGGGTTIVIRENRP